jgi:hypothetical protein
MLPAGQRRAHGLVHLKPGQQVARRQFDQAVAAKAQQAARPQGLEQRLVFQTGARDQRHGPDAGTQAQHDRRAGCGKGLHQRGCCGLLTWLEML